MLLLLPLLIWLTLQLLVASGMWQTPTSSATPTKTGRQCTQGERWVGSTLLASSKSIDQSEAQVAVGF
jgi:hypothetical protein